MAHEKTSGKTVLLLLAAGGGIVAISFVVDRIFGVGTWAAWRIASILHVIGGAYGFFFVRALFFYSRGAHRTVTAHWMETIIFVGGALVLGVMWEWYEFAVDRYHVIAMGGESIMTYADNIGDLLFDAAGALAAAFFLKQYGGRK